MSRQSENNQNLVQKIKEEFLYHFDIFVQQPNFTILNCSKFPSVLGFLISIMIALFGLYFFLTEVVSMVSQSKPAIYQTELYIYLKLNHSSFKMITLLQQYLFVNRYSQPLIGINRYFQLNISQCVRLRIKDQYSGNIFVNLNCSQIPIETCNMSNFTTDIQKQYFSIIRMGGIQYINRKYLKENPLILQGQISSNAFRYIFIQFTACQNTSLFQSCAPQQEIDNIFQSGHYNVYKSDYLSKLDQPRQPYLEIIINEFTSFSLSNSKTISQNIKSYKHLQMKDQFGNKLKINQIFNKVNGERYLNFIIINIQLFIIQIIQQVGRDIQKRFKFGNINNYDQYKLILSYNLINNFKDSLVRLNKQSTITNNLKFQYNILYHYQLQI